MVGCFSRRGGFDKKPKHLKNLTKKNDSHTVEVNLNNQESKNN
jgi:hypothetical protein